jgi:paraquat-inducible protein A
MHVTTYNKPPPDTALVACPDCDLLQRLPAIAPGGEAHCCRCDRELARRPADSRNRIMALTLAAAILWIAANCVPMLGLSVIGHQASTTVLGGALHLWNNGQPIVAVLILFTAVVAPAMQIGFLLAVGLGTARTPAPRWVGAMLRHHPTLCEWSMIEVMLIGVLVALIKIAELASVIPGLALFMLAGLVFILAGMQSSVDRRAIWESVTWANEAAR